MSRHPVPAAPPDSAAAGLPGSYSCISDDMLYEVLTAPKSQGGGLLLRRRYPSEPDWRPAVPTTTEHLHRLLSYGSFTRIDP